MKKLVFLLICLLLLGSALAWAQVESPVIVVRVIETPYKVHIAIARGEAKPELIEFDGGYLLKDTGRVADLYQRVVGKLYAEGYVLQGTIAASGEGSLNRSLLFVKAPQP